MPKDIAQDRYDRTTSPPTDAHTVGQVFVARQPNLSAVEVLLDPQEASEPRQFSAITFHLRSSPESETDLVAVSLNTTPIQREAVLHFDFPPQPDSAGKSYYFFLSGTPSNSGGIRYAALDVYHDGTHFADHQAADGDLRFTTYYTYTLPQAINDILQGLAHHGLAPLRVILASLALLFLPGSALLVLTGYSAPIPATWGFRAGTSDKPRATSVDWLDWLALAFGLSLGLIPLLLLWTSALRLRLGPGALTALLVCLALVVVYRLVSKGAAATAVPWKALATDRSVLRQVAWSVGGMLLLALILAVRFIQIREVVLPLWVDSVHHTMIARLIAEAGRLPSTYRPFMPVDNFYYHYGFHALAACFQWLSGLEMPQVLLVLGQTLNAGAALSAYLLAVRFTRRRLAGMCAMLISGLISVMPAYYVSWGRYTQLTGLNILPVVLVLAVEWLREFQISDPSTPLPSSRLGTGRASFRLQISNAQGGLPNPLLLSRLLLATVSLAGLFLTHYRVLIFAICFFLVYAVYAGWPQRRSRTHLARLGLAWLALGGLAMLMALPWVGQLIRTTILAKGMAFLGQIKGEPGHNIAPLGYVLTGADRVLIALSAGGCLWSFLRRERGVLLILAWMLVVFLAVNPSIIGLPTTWLLSNVSTLIILYLPFGVATGYMLTTLYDYAIAAIERRWHTVLQVIITVAFALAALWGTWQQIPVINPATILAEKEDLDAMEWIRQNTSPSAVFLINTQYWTLNVYRGSDGGWWIRLLTGRQVTLPPVNYVFGPSDHIGRVNALAQAVSKAKSLNEAGIRAMLKDYGVTHVYIGARGGNLTPWTLIHSPYYKLVYSNGAVWIFEVLDL